MLTLSAGSSCDVCFERFGRDLKAPCSIICGHVFCFDCVSHVNRLCPLCRTYFEPSSCIKLHLDVEVAPPLDQVSGSSSDDEKEAQRIHRAILKIADSGIDEQGLKQLIQEGRDFLHRQPRHLYKELRNSHRMMAYMCELKSSLLGQKHLNEDMNEQVQRLSSEKAELLKKLVESDELRKYERETALAVETSLREHYALASRNYQVLIEVYNKLAQSTNEYLKTVPVSSSTSMSAPNSRLTSTPISDLLPPLDMKALDGVAARDPESNFLISPLPQFTNNLPSVLDGFRPLPELAEDAEGEEKSDEDEELSTPDSSQNHRPIQGIQDIKTLSYMRSAESISPRRSDGAKGLEPSGLSRTAPYLEHNRRARSSSNPSRPTSRSQSPFDRSGTTSPRMTPPHHVGTSSPPRFASKHTEPDVLRTRLHDLLRDSPTSSSMPNLPSNHFPPTLTNRDREHSALATAVSPPPTRTGSSNSSKTSAPHQQPSNDGVSHLLASGPQVQPPNKPVPSPSPNTLVGQKVSSASAQAKQLEEERRRRYLEERQNRDERQKEEKYRDERQRDDRYREDRPRDDRHREERYREDKNRDERYGQDYERSPVDVDREHRSKASSSNGGSVPPVPTNRRDQTPNVNHIYGNPLATNSGGASLKRGSSVTNGHSRPAAVSPTTPLSVPEPPLIRYNPGSSSSNKPRPMAIPPNSAGIYAS